VFEADTRRQASYTNLGLDPLQAGASKPQREMDHLA